MRGRTSALKIELTTTNRAILLSWLRSQKTPVGRAKRARAILLLAEGKTLYTRRLRAEEMVLCIDEKTSLQPRPRKAKTLPAQPGCPVRVENEYERKGALNLFAAFDTRTGQVWGLAL